MVVFGAELLTVLRIEETRLLDFFPAGKVTDKSRRTPVTGKLDVEQNVTSELAYIQRNGVVGLVDCQFAVEFLDHLVVFDNPDMCETLVFLHREENKLLGSLHPLHSVVLT